MWSQGVWRKKRHADHWNVTESPEIGPVNVVSGPLTRGQRQHDGAEVAAQHGVLEQLAVPVRKAESRHRPATFAR